MRKYLLAAALVICATPTAALANILTPGQENQAPDALSLAGMTLYTSTTGTLDSLTFDATYTAAVYFGGSNPFCHGCITVAYQVKDISGVGSGTGIIEDLTASSFSNFSTDVGYAVLSSPLNGFVAGGSTPLTVGRSLAGNGSVVSFDFPDQGVASKTIQPGDNTAVLIVETSADYYTAGMFSAIDGASATNGGYEPVTPTTHGTSTPEPNSMALAGLGFVGIGLLLKRLHRQA